jgi:Tfp pilus assembly protein PilN
MPAGGSINLLPKDNWDRGLSAKILNWALTFGRYIVIITELVVVAAFIARFSLDQKLSDLHDSIKQKQVFIQANLEFENEFRDLQTRLYALNEAVSAQTNAKEVLDTFSSLTPANVRFSSFSYNQNVFEIKALSPTEDGLGAFINALSTNPNIKNLESSSVVIASDREEVEFTILGEWVRKGGTADGV